MDTFFMDVAPLQEAEFTGIPQVAAKLCEMLLGDTAVEPAFFCNRMEIPRSLIEQLLVSRDGRLFRWAAERYVLAPLLPVRAPGGRTVGLHANIKFARRLFPIEGQIVHDLTTIVTPHYHTAEANAFHQERFYGDVMSNDITFCVSASTAADLKMLFPETPGPVRVAHLGTDWDHIDAESRALEVTAERYVLVLGTLEPRKNVRDVLRLLAQKPQLARQYRFAFSGRIGWGDAFESQIAALGLQSLYDEGRIVRTGFVSEATKYLLFKHAAAVIYPSVYEGFGLPVAEAMSLGVPVVTTPSSSLPEVGGDVAHYFIPGDLKMFEGALDAALAQPADARAAVRRAYGERFSWARCYATIKDGLFEAAAAAADATKGADVRH